MPKRIPIRPPKEASRFFRAKVPLTRPEFNTLVEEAKRRAFTVAAVTSMDVLHDIKAALDKAIDAGEMLADFGNRLEEIMDARGWTGLTPWHAETVFRTNVQSAYGAGRYEQHLSVSDEYPYARYDALLDGRQREEHGALDGTIAPVDSAFWKTHWPPWDYQCRCAAEPMAADEVKGREIFRGVGPDSDSDFTSPALGADWIPDLSRFDPDEAETLRRVLGR